MWQCLVIVTVIPQLACTTLIPNISTSHDEISSSNTLPADLTEIAGNATTPSTAPPSLAQPLEGSAANPRRSVSNQTTTTASTPPTGNAKGVPNSGNVNKTTNFQNYDTNSAHVTVSSAKSDNVTMIVPKCCPVGSVLTSIGCQKDGVHFEPGFKVFKHNTTHLDDTPLEGVVFQPYLYDLRCTSGRYGLDDEKEAFGILQNGSLILNGADRRGLMSPKEFCVENVEESGNYSLQVLVCAPEVRINHAMFHAYLTLTILSIICFAAAFIVYYFILKCEDIHKLCFAWYSLSMCVTFICLAVVQSIHIENKGCVVMGFFFQACMISSFTWLAVLCVDIYLLVLYFDDNMKKGKRKAYYIATGIIVPILSLVVAVSRNQIPDVPNSFFKPQYGRNLCYFEADNQRRWFFYFPIMCTIIVSIISLAMTKYRIVQLDRKKTYNYDWLGNQKNYKFMFRRYFIVFIMMLLWVVEAIINVTYTSSSMIVTVDLLEATQGILTLALFVLNREAKSKIDSGIKKHKTRKNLKLNQALEPEGLPLKNFE